MEIIKPKNCWYPLKNVTIQEDATLYEAVKALEKAQKEQDRKRHPYLHITEMCIHAGDRNVKDCIYSPSEGEYVEAEAYLCEAIYMFVIDQVRRND